MILVKGFYVSANTVVYFGFSDEKTQTLEYYFLWKISLRKPVLIK